MVIDASQPMTTIHLVDSRGTHNSCPDASVRNLGKPLEDKSC
jgi:hypothetical protein